VSKPGVHELDWPSQKDHLWRVFPRAALAQVTAAALDHPTLVTLCRRLALPLATATDNTSKAHLVGLILDAAAGAAAEATRALVDALDEACGHERRLLASLPEATLLGELAKHNEARRFRRQGAKLLWALARDGRAVADAAVADALHDYLTAQSRRVVAVSNAEHASPESPLPCGQPASPLAPDSLAPPPRRDPSAPPQPADPFVSDSFAPPAPPDPQAPLVEAPGQRLVRRRLAGPGSRVGVFLDVANLSGAARRLYGRAVDFRALLGVVVGQRRLVEARAYVIDKGSDKSGFDGFGRALRAAGYKVFAKRPKVFPDGTVKADWDVGIAVDILTAYERFDVVVLGSGDGDFVPVLMALKQRGLHVEVASFGARTAAELARVADDVLDLDDTVLER